MAELTDRDLILIRSSAMFSSLSDEAIRALLADSTRLSFQPGEWVFRKDERAEYFFVLLVGHVRLFQMLPPDAEEQIGLFSPGQVIADDVVLQGKSYPCHAEAIDPVQLLAVGRETFEAALKQNLRTVAGLVGGLSGKLKDMARLAEKFAKKTAANRAARMLLQAAEVSGSNSFRFGQSFEEIAKALGCTGRMLQDTLLAFQRQGLIRLSDDQVTLTDEPALRFLAEE